MQNLRIRLLGVPAIELDGEPVDPGRRKVIALAAYLSANETPQSRDGICAVLWPEKSGQVARAELRRTISSLRNCVGTRFVEATRSQVSLSPEVAVDVREFRALLESTAADRQDSTGVSADCIRALKRAVGLYRGDFLAGFSLSDSPAFDDWTIFEAERLRDLLGTALERLSRPVISDRGELPSESTLLDYGRRWLQLDNLNEAAHRRLMLLYALAGHRGAALRQYTSCVKLLEEELGTSPERETLSLKRRIENGSVTAEPVAARNDRTEVDRRTNEETRNVSEDRGRHKRTVKIAVAAVLAGAVVLASIYVVSLIARRQTGGIPIAVLPLLDNSSDSHNGWFVEGMTEAITTDLAKIGGLRVTSRSSADVLGGRRSSIAQIRELLGVDYVVEGSVLRAENRVRITAQLIDARRDRHLWAAEYESRLTDIIALQGRIAEDIASQVTSRLAPREKGALTRRRPVDPVAYEAYLLGAYELARLPFDPGAAGKCLADLKRSVVSDDGYAPVHAALANYYWGATQFGLYSSEEGMKLAKAEAERAVALDESLSEAHTVLGFMRFLHDYDWRGSEQEFKRAISLKPSSAEAHCWYGSLLCTEGRYDEAIAEVTKARDIDPLSLINILNVAMRLYYARDYEGAIEQAGMARSMESGFYMTHLVLGYALAAKGSTSEAITELEEAAKLAGDGAMEPLAVLSYIYNRAGRESDAERAEHRFEALGAKGMTLSPLLRAYIPLGRGDYNAAMDLIEQAYVERDLNLAWNFQDPFFDPLRALPRFEHLKEQMNL